MERTPLEVEVDKLVAWCEANSADNANLREALTAAGMRLGQRADKARSDELAGITAARDAERVRTGKTPIVTERQPEAASLAEPAPR